MHLRIAAVAAFGMLGLQPVQAGQPIHESLVECAVLIELLIGEETPTRKNETIAFYMAAAKAMRTEAEARNGASYVRKTAAAKRDIWHVRWDEGDWDNPANRGDLVEWYSYCMKLGKHLNLPLND